MQQGRPFLPLMQLKCVSIDKSGQQHVSNNKSGVYSQQEMLSKTEKEKRPLHRQVAMSVSSASTHSMESTQTKSLEAQDDIVLRRSSHYPQGVYIHLNSSSPY